MYFIILRYLNHFLFLWRAYLDFLEILVFGILTRFFVHFFIYERIRQQQQKQQHLLLFLLLLKFNIIAK